MKINPFKVHMPESVLPSVEKILLSGFIGQGEKVDEFENKFSEKFKVTNSVSVNSGTSALRLALSLAGVGPGDEVITTPYTMVATNTAILEQFATPVFADIEYENINISSRDIEKRITSKTKAIICVHWGGYPCNMDEILQISSKYNIPVIEDAAHALGATYKGKSIGTTSDYTAFSFQAIKHLTTVDGGMLCVKDKNKFIEAKQRRWFGIDRANRNKTVDEDPIVDIKENGFKYHMNDVTATIGIEQLNCFDSLFNRRTEIANNYRNNLSDISGITLLEAKTNRTNANWMFAVHCDKRTEFINYMHSEGIGVTVHNWRNDRYSVFGGTREDLPNTNKVNSTLVNLPLHHAISDEEIIFIIERIKSFSKRYYG